MTFHSPSIWCLALLALLPVLFLLWRRRRRDRGIAFPALVVAESAGRSWASRIRGLVPALRFLAIALLIVALARPQRPDEQAWTKTDAVAIGLIVDRSGSMRAEDFTLDGRPASRLAAVRRVVEAFVVGDETQRGRTGDLIGLISFASFADSVCPLTLDHDHLVNAIHETRISEDQNDLATAIGDAVALGVERLSGLDRRADVTGEQRIRSRVLVLLTDGESNAGEIEPLVAADMAAAFGIRIYTIGAGTENGFAPVPGVDLFGRPTRQMQRMSIDEETLKAIAEATGGRYFRATDTESLANIYREIDQLERTEIEQHHLTDVTEMAVDGVRLGRVGVPPLLAVVFGVLFLEIALLATRFRGLP